jgi:AcrR family transcriptional regulator
MAELEPWLQELLSLQEGDDKKTDKQIKILQAAVDMFAEKGYAATSTSEIAQKAGVAEGTIFRHYKTKKDLLLSIVAPVMSSLVAPFVMRDLSKVLEKDFGRFEDFLRATIENRAEFAKKHIQALKILLQEVPFHPELRERFIENIAKQVLMRFERIIETFQSKGQIVPMPTARAMRLAASSVFGYLIMRYMVLPEKDWNDKEEIEALIEYIMHGLSPKP